jgi:hypothetical protein
VSIVIGVSGFARRDRRVSEGDVHHCDLAFAGHFEANGVW